MEQWSEIRRRVLVEGVSRRQIIRETGMHWETLQKILQHSEPLGYRQRRTRPRKKLGPYPQPDTECQRTIPKRTGQVKRGQFLKIGNGGTGIA